MMRIAALVLSGILLAGCSDEASRDAPSVTAPQNLPVEGNAETQDRASAPERTAYFGDLHVHTRYS